MLQYFAFSALTELVGQQEGYPACEKTEWWDTGMVYLSGARCRFAYDPADLTATHYLLLQQIQIGFTGRPTFLVQAHSGGPGQKAIIALFYTLLLCFYFQ